MWGINYQLLRLVSILNPFTFTCVRIQHEKLKILLSHTCSPYLASITVTMPRMNKKYTFLGICYLGTTLCALNAVTFWCLVLLYCLHHFHSYLKQTFGPTACHNRVDSWVFSVMSMTPFMQTHTCTLTSTSKKYHPHWNHLGKKCVFKAVLEP